MPNRDCNAYSSNGEICCSGKPPNFFTGNCDDDSYNSGNCTKGLSRYKTEYVDAIVKVLKQFPNINIVAVIEPDSLPNIATNEGVTPHCTKTTSQGYIEGVTYTIQ